jgi:BolA protein
MTAKIETAIRAQLDIHHIEIIDDSAKHAGHKQNSGGGHYNAFIISDSFEGKSLIHRHRMVYDALGEMMTNDIHAFSMKTLTVDEFKKTN